MSHLRQRSRVVRVLVAIAGAAAVASCAGDGPTGPAPVSRITVTPATVTVIAGQSATLAAQALDAAGAVLAGQTLAWSSSDTSVATVAAGIVSAKKPGAVTIAAASGAIQGTAAVTVVPVPVASVSVAPTPDTIIVGRSVQLAATPSDAAGIVLAGRVVAWLSSDTTIATVSGTGLVTGRATGAATVTATVEGKSGAAQVVVRPVPVASIALTPSATSIVAGASQTIAAATKDVDGNVLTGRTVTWTTSNAAVATVDNAGMVTAVAAGSAVITAASGTVTAQATVTVTPAFVLTSIGVAAAGGTSILVGQTLALTALPRDQFGNPISATVSWSTSNASVATVSATGTVMAAGPGTAVITATSGSVNGSLTITVSPVPVMSVLITSPGATTSIPALTTLLLGAVTRDSAGGTLSGRAITWASSDTTVATVSAAGLVSARKTGTVAITATSEGKSGAFTLTVTAATVASVSVTVPSTLLIADNVEAATASPRDAQGTALSGRTVTWTTSDPSVATVSSTGVIFARLPGTAVITATSEGRSGSVSINIPALLSVVTGWSHSCVLSTEGGVLCWGNNGSYQLNNPDTTARRGPISSALGFASISSKKNHVCALSGSDAAYCWGQNYTGELGNGTTANGQLIQPVSGGLSFLAVAAGGYSCGIAMSGEGYCWGTAAGGTGDGTTGQERIVPSKILGGRLLQAIVVGGSHACALDRSGQAFCWGAGERGQLGTGTTASTTAPVAVNTTLRFAEIAAGISHTCGRTSGGSLYCWGANATGQLGDGTTTDRYVPTAVAGGSTFSSVTATYSHTCGVNVASQALCWGANNVGQLGTGDNTQYATPTLVAGGRSFFVLAAGGASDGRTCGLTLNSGVYCWGNLPPTKGSGLGTTSLVPVLVPNPGT